MTNGNFTFLLLISLVSLYGHRNSAHITLEPIKKIKMKQIPAVLTSWNFSQFERTLTRPLSALDYIKKCWAQKGPGGEVIFFSWRRVLTWGRMVEFSYRALAGGAQG